MFGVNWYSCQDQQSFCNPKQNGCKENPACPGANAIFTDEFKVHYRKDKTGPNTWTKSLVVGEYRGPISIDLFAPLPLAAAWAGNGSGHWRVSNRVLRHRAPAHSSRRRSLCRRTMGADVYPSLGKLSTLTRSRVLARKRCQRSGCLSCTFSNDCGVRA